MGGGGGKPLNIFRLGRSLEDEPKEVLNWRLWFAVFSFGIMGAARGVDEGLISGTFNTVHFQKLLHFDDLDEEDYANVKEMSLPWSKLVAWAVLFLPSFLPIALDVFGRPDNYALSGLSVSSFS